jgi:hypothetical protein
VSGRDAAAQPWVGAIEVECDRGGVVVRDRTGGHEHPTLVDERQGCATTHLQALTGHDDSVG